MNSKELPTHRLATTDQQGNRIYLYPIEVSGKWRSRRSRLSAVLIVLFLILPWIKINGHQAILLDISHRKFAIFGVAFWAHDAPLLIFIFGGAALTLALVTAIWGRIWCSWACPQTVFIDGVFRRVEYWIEGDALTRRKRDEAPLSWEKGLKKTLKWGVFTLLSLLISHSFLAYFFGTKALAQMMRSAPSENPMSFLVMGGITLLILFDFGWFREQFCTLVCPYGRFQSVLMDDESQVIAYDAHRGEPRKGSPSDANSTRPQGDCVNCYQCVRACPTGIDIRRGVQLECIACTACIDACDQVMAKIKKPSGLIRYDSLAGILGHEQSQLKFYQKPKVLLFGALLMFMLAGLATTLHFREPLEATFIRAVGVPYQELIGANGQSEVINHFKLDLRNQTFEPQNIKLKLDSSSEELKSVQSVVSNHSDLLEEGSSERADVFFRYQKSILKTGKRAIPIIIEIHNLKSNTHFTLNQEVLLVGPIR